jgi:hypothetical protein
MQMIDASISIRLVGAPHEPSEALGSCGLGVGDAESPRPGCYVHVEGVECLPTSFELVSRLAQRIPTVAVICLSAPAET